VWLAVVLGSLTLAASPTIEHPPTPQAAVMGGRAVFTVVASGSAPLAHEWRLDGEPLADGPGVAGATSDGLVLTGVGQDDVGSYSVVVSNGEGSATSAEAALTVVAPQAGDLDLSFDPGLRIDGDVWCLAVRPDGRVVIGGDFTTVHGAARGRIARLAADGTTDLAFADGLSGADGTVRAVVAAPDGSVLMAGSFTSVHGAARNRIARLRSNGSLDTSFLNGLAGPNLAVHALAVQPDGRVLIGGEFTSVNGLARNRIARLNSDGSLDATFSGVPGISGPVHAIALQPDGRILVGGDFFGADGVGRHHVARLEADGTLDESFLSGVFGPSDPVRTIALAPDGRILIGGDFTSYQGTGRHHLARLEPDGTLDTTFLDGLAGPDGIPLSIAVQPDGRVWIGGPFASVHGENRPGIARLEADGSLDPTVLVDVSGAGSVRALALGPEGRVVIGGSFVAVHGVSRHRIARLQDDGSIDLGFENPLAGPSSDVYAIAVQPDGRIVIGGGFTTVGGVSRNRIARLEADGRLDTSFLDGLAGTGSVGFNPVRSLAVQPDGRILIAGRFTTVNGVGRNNVARLEPDGSLDPTFLAGLSGTNGDVYALAPQPDGRVLIGGTFTTVHGVTRHRVARLEADGSLDETFPDVLADELIFSIVLDPDGRILIGGWFTTVHGASRNRIARLHGDGTLDAGFLDGLSGADSLVHSVALAPDDRIYIGGDFMTVNGVPRRRIARLEADGGLDTSFLDGQLGAANLVHEVDVQTDGRVLIGGRFSSVNSIPRRYLARLEPDGSVDTGFLTGQTGPDPLGWIETLVVLADGRLLVGGRFRTFHGEPRARITRLHGSPPVAPSIVEQPASQDAHDACCAVFRVGATGTPLDYRWRKDGVELEDGDGVSGASTSILTLTGVGEADEGAYSVVVSSLLGEETSDDAILVVSPLPPCRTGTCDPQIGCVAILLPDGAGCDLDANVCTPDACEAGTCQSRACSCILAPDADGDGFGEPGAAVTTCDPAVPPDHAANAGDCDDTSPDVRPGGPEVCDGAANDCSEPGWPELVDADRDLVEDTCDNCASTSNPLQADADADARGNACDNCRRVPNPEQANADADVHGDDCDNCGLDANDAQSDADGDATGDACEVDSDDDGVLEDDGDAVDDPCTGGRIASCDDNCPVAANPLQGDADGDGRGDACDGCAAHADFDQHDADRDGTGDACDPCTDRDGDGLGDPGFVLVSCPEDDCPHDGLNDADGDGACGDADDCPDAPDALQQDGDGDGVGDACDNCPADPNPDQHNADRALEDPGPYRGDACDPDLDGDGIANELDPDRDGDGVAEDDGDGALDPCPHQVRSECDDNCPTTANAGQLDGDGGGRGNACDPGDGDVHGVTIGRGPASGPAVLSWQREDDALSYDLYRGLASALSPFELGTCHRSAVPTTWAAIAEDPPPGQAFTYLVTVRTATGGGTLGRDSDNVLRIHANPCPP
jgi:uncharacterized delta-60 repeat protein